jgi:class 3 adenylate cyclase/tetratricopeptide (TPR) repeat protein
MNSDLATWLETQGLGQYASLLKDNEVDLDALQLLTEADLHELGIPLGPRKKLLRAIATLKPSSAVSVSAPLAPDSYTPGHLAQKILTSRSALEGERKQVTVLFCDIADSTALAVQVGAEPMHSILNRFFHLAMDEIHRYEGTVNQFLGDGFMALFGAPLGHEDHARRAVLAALGIRRALDDKQTQLGLPVGLKLAVRVGLHTGPVVVGSIGDNLRMDYTAIGDTTHLAARLQQAGAPGQILMSDTTARMVRGYVTSVAMTPLVLKGKPEPVDAFEIIAPGRRRSRLDEDRALSPFVGREREFAILREALEEAVAGRGQVVGIVGEPGMGKSRLLYEFRRMLNAREVVYLEGWCLSFGQSIPYLPLQDVLRTTCGIAVADSPAQIGQRVRAVLQQAGLPHDELAPYLLQALGVKEGTDALAQISPEVIKARTLDTLQRMALAQSAQRPLILAIEDLHWIDKTSEEFLVRLTESLAGARLLLVTTSRPGYTPPWLGKSYVTQLPVRVLTSDAARRIVEAATNAVPLLSEAATASILRKAEGNPFFLEELALALRERGGLDAAQVLPDTIQGVLAARIDRLPDATKRVLQTAAVLGREFSLQLLEAVVDVPDGTSGQLDTLKHNEFLYERTEAEGPVFVFKHALTQEVAYDSLLTSRKESLHEAAGRGIELLYPGRLEEHYEMLAHHYSRGGNAEKAIEYLDHANLKALKANAVEDAQAYFNEAFRQYSKLADNVERKRARVALMVRQAPVFMLQMKMGEYEALLRAAEPDAESIGDDGLLGRFLACLGHCHWYSARYTEAIETNLRAAALAERSGVFDGAGHGLMLVQWSHLWAGDDFEKVLEFEASALHALDRAPHNRYRMWSLTASSWAASCLGRWDIAIQKAQRAIMDGETVSDPSLVCFAMWILGLAYAQKGDVDTAMQHAQKAVDIAPTPGDRAWASQSLLWGLLRREPGRAIEQLEPLVEMYRLLGSKALGAFAGLILGEAYLSAGRFEDASKLAHSIRDLCAGCGQSYWQAVSHRIIGQALLSAENGGGRDDARLHLEAAIRLQEARKAEPELAHAYAWFGRLKMKDGDPAAARDYLNRALAIYERLDMQSDPQGVREDLAALDSAHGR